MPEWSIGPHSKCGVRATVPGVRIPLFPQKNEARRCRRISASFCFVTLRHANLFVRRSGMKTKVVDLSTPCGVRILQGAPRRAKGKTSRHEVATKSFPLFPLNEAYKKLIINLVGFFMSKKMHQKCTEPRFYALLRASSLALTNLTTNPKKNKHLQYHKLSSYAIDHPSSEGGLFISTPIQDIFKYYFFNLTFYTFVYLYIIT